MKTTDQIRDELAMAFGWRFNRSTGCWVRQGEADTPVRGMEFGRHPIPTTIDGIAALMPGGWLVRLEVSRMYSCACSAWPENLRLEPQTAEANTEYEARLRLLHSVLSAKENP